MPTKYIRPDFREFASGIRTQLHASSERPIREDVRVPNTRAMIFIVLGAIVLVSLVSHLMNRSFSLKTLQLTYGEAVVIRKEYRENGQTGPTYVLEIEIAAENGSILTDRVVTDAASWDRVAEGQEVDVAYWLSPGKNKCRVYQINLKPAQPERGDVTEQQ